MLLRVIVQEPKYQQNVGYIARISKNFGVRKLFFIKPRTDIRGKTAIMYSKHAHDLLERATVCGSMAAATKGCNLVVGTTGVWAKARSHFNNAYPLKEAIEVVKSAGRGRKGFKIGLILGREDIGMMADELYKCDVVCTIEANTEYPVLNVSHALAILLYELTSEGFGNAYEGKEQGKAGKGELDTLFRVFGTMVDAKRSVRNKKAVKRVFRKLILSSGLDPRELHALITALK